MKNIKKILAKSSFEKLNINELNKKQMISVMGGGQTPTKSIGIIVLPDVSM